MTATPEWFTLTEAAGFTGKSRVTLRRYLDADRFPNARRRPGDSAVDGPWEIPLTDLVHAHLVSDNADTGGVVVDAVLPPRVARELRARLDAAERARRELMDQLSRHERDLARASSLADERAQWIEVLEATNNRLLVLLEAAVGGRSIYTQ